MPDIRKRGIAYLSKRTNNPELIAVSKEHTAEESWTGSPVWWFDISIDKIQSNPDQVYYLLCEKGNREFHILQVPNKFFIDNMDKFESRYDNKIRLHLDTEQDNRFVDQRGPGKMDLSSYLMDT